MNQSMAEQTAKNAELATKLQALHQQPSLMIASLNADGSPLISYAPFYERDGVFYVFVSLLAEHTPNLLERPQASVMLLRDEATTTNHFVRERVRYEVVCRPVACEEAVYESILQGLEQKQGRIVALLKSLADFYLIALEPTVGNLVVGAGAAYRFKAGESVFEQVRGR
ncbi:HugZ family protein [Oligella urethralis]|uniref:HugZ family pyridoxamine 5'-phosphate oxidase n=1 Tax=Oligella urethralis TaxID=90245 RepID=UPI00065F9E8D|nr:pyridoxamine 5'-phosphate oxidase family protein [Oligella urethralis]